MPKSEVGVRDQGSKAVLDEVDESMKVPSPI